MRRALAARLCWLGIASATLASAEPVDPSVPRTIAIGAAPGAAPLERVDRERSGRSRWALPDRPKNLWQTRVPGPLAFNLAVDERGGAVVLTQAGELFQLDAKGKVEWSARSAPLNPASGPFITADRLRGFVTRSAEVFAFTHLGRLAYRVPLRKGMAPDSRQTAPNVLRPPTSPAVTATTLVRSDSNLIVAFGSELYQLGQGEVQHRATLGDRAVTLLEVSGATLIVTAAGAVLEWWPPSPPRELGSFGGELDGGAALLDAGRLVGVVDRSRVVAFDVTRRLRLLGFNDPALMPLGPPAIVRPGALRFLTREGVLLAQSALNAEGLRLPLDVQARPSDPTVPVAAPLIVDAAGRTAVARAGQPLLVVHPDGRLESAPGTECGEPLSVAPAGERRILLACRDGGMWLLGG